MEQKIQYLKVGSPLREHTSQKPYHHLEKNKLKMDFVYYKHYKPQL